MKKGSDHNTNDSGYRSVLTVSIPLILSTGSVTLQHFVDRVFLTWVSPDAIAAAMPAGILNYAIMSIFIGTSVYVSTFTAQYLGAGQQEKIGAYVWQGMYFALLAGVSVLPLLSLSADLFRIAGHAPAVQALENDYFRILLANGFAVTASSAIAGFFSGRGRTKIVMWESFITTAVNIVLDYLLIFGKAGFPELGIRGAALATVAAQYTRLTFYLILFFSRDNRERFRTLAAWRFRADYFLQLIRFGLPNGVHFFLEMTGFTILILLVGRLGVTELAATNITFNINHLVFMPLMGLSMGVSVLVGNRIGEGRPDAARRLTWAASHIGFIFVALISLSYAFLPDLFLAPYKANAGGADYTTISDMAAKLLKFVAVYSLFDCMNIIFSAAVKGAGDTRFVMWISVLLSWGIMVIPSYLAITRFNGTIFWLWTFATLYIVLIGLIFMARFLGNKWETMSVIRQEA
ncbi:MATE family efflux transporter [bacterium]|nr:MATE family efflux transporter [bacterium]